MDYFIKESFVAHEKNQYHVYGLDGERVSDAFYNKKWAEDCCYLLNVAAFERLKKEGEVVEFPLDIYDPFYFNRSDGISAWAEKKMRMGDAVAAVGYALGIPSFEKIQELFGFQGSGKNVNDSSLTAMEALDVLRANKTRDPKCILDVGGGRGEVSLALTYLGCKVQMVEPHPMAEHWCKATWNQLFDDKGDVEMDLIPKGFPECLPGIDLDNLDTVMFVESLEHIPEENFNEVWPTIKLSLVRNKGLLVCANWIDYHPIKVENKEHCRLVDDVLYDRMAEGGKTVYRNGSHLVVQF